MTRRLESISTRKLWRLDLSSPTSFTLRLVIGMMMNVKLCSDRVNDQSKPLSLDLQMIP